MSAWGWEDSSNKPIWRRICWCNNKTWEAIIQVEWINRGTLKRWPILRKHSDTRRWNSKRKERMARTYVFNLWNCPSKTPSPKTSKKQTKRNWKSSMSLLFKAKGRRNYLSSESRKPTNWRWIWDSCKTSWMKEKGCICKTEILWLRIAVNNPTLTIWRDRFKLCSKRLKKCKMKRELHKSIDSSLTSLTSNQTIPDTLLSAIMQIQPTTLRRRKPQSHLQGHWLLKPITTTSTFNWRSHPLLTSRAVKLQVQTWVWKTHTRRETNTLRMRFSKKVKTMRRKSMMRSLSKSQAIKRRRLKMSFLQAPPKAICKTKLRLVVRKKKITMRTKNTLHVYTTWRRARRKYKLRDSCRTSSSAPETIRKWSFKWWREIKIAWKRAHCTWITRIYSTITFSASLNSVSSLIPPKHWW